MKPNPKYIPIASLDWDPEDLAIDITLHGYTLKPTKNLESMGEPIDYTIDHQDRIVYIDTEIDRDRFRQAVNRAYDDVRVHVPKSLPVDQQAPKPDTSPWAVPPTPKPGPDDWVEQWYEVHRVALELFEEAAEGYDHNTARLAAILFWCGLDYETQRAMTEAKTNEVMSYVGPAGWFMGVDCEKVHVTLPPAARRMMDQSTTRAQEANSGRFLAGCDFSPAFYAFRFAPADTIAGLMIDAAMMLNDST